MKFKSLTTFKMKDGRLAFRKNKVYDGKIVHGWLILKSLLSESHYVLLTISPKYFTELPCTPLEHTPKA